MPSVVEIPCPECEKVLKVPDTVFGKKIKCKYCTHAFVVERPLGREETDEAGREAVQARRRSVKPKKEEPKPAPKKEEPKKEEPAPYKFQDDDDEGAKPNPLGVIAEEDVPRCPFCAKELDPPDAVVCIHCGFNSMTRTRAESKKVWAPDTNDYINHLGPGVAALAIFIALIVLDIVCLTEHARLDDGHIPSEGREGRAR